MTAITFAIGFAALAIILRYKARRQWPEHAITEPDMIRSEEAVWLSWASWGCFAAAAVAMVCALP